MKTFFLILDWCKVIVLFLFCYYTFFCGMMDVVQYMAFLLLLYVPFVYCFEIFVYILLMIL